MEAQLTPTQRLWRLLKPDAKETRNIYIYAGFAGLIGLSLPLGIQAIVNLIQGGQINTSWIVLVSVVVAGIGFTGVLQLFQIRIAENIQQKIFSRAAFEFAYRLPQIRMDVIYRHYAPELTNRFFDTITLQKGLAKLLIDFSSASLYIIFGLILLSLYHPFFILFSFVLLFLLYLIFQLTAKRGLTTSLTESKNKYIVAHWLEEVSRTHSTFKLSGSMSLPLSRTDKHVGDYLESRESHFKVLMNQYSMMVVFKVIVAAGLLVLGGILVMQERMNVGQFVAAEIVILTVMSAVEKLVLSLETIYDVLTSLEKIAQVTDLELDRVDGMDIPVDEHHQSGLAIEMADVCFTYPNASRKTLNGIDMSIKPGERIAIAGSNGSGKSTLLQVIAGVYDIDEGHLAFNGLPLGNLKLGSLRAAIGDHLSHELLFEGSVLENITMGREAATLERVLLLIEELGLQEFIQTLPKGLETQIDPQGRKLPRSVVQKLLIARAVADSPKLLLLDHPMTNLVATDKECVAKLLMGEERKWTVLVVTTDPVILSKTDRIAVLHDGRIAEWQTPEEYFETHDLKPLSHA